MRSHDPTVFAGAGPQVSTGTPFWPLPLDRYPGRLPERADVLVIGGGITDVSLMHHPGTACIGAVLVERDPLSAGAGWRGRVPGYPPA